MLARKNTGHLLIFDLDDTLFETRSIDFAHFNGLWKIIEGHFSHSEFDATQVIEDFKDFPFDVVSEKYSFSGTLIEEIKAQFDGIKPELNISVFDDYHQIQKLHSEKVIVTTGFTSLQNAKIDSLNIRGDFTEIHIDDPMDQARKNKRGIFYDLMHRKKVQPANVWVIGDNPESELKAGKELRFNTIQRLVRGREKSFYADITIHSFVNLHSIVG